MNKNPALSTPEAEAEKIKEISSHIWEKYRQLRGSSYPLNKEYLDAWEYAFSEKEGVSINLENNWIFRGRFLNEGESTVRRASLNVSVDTELIDELDKLILNGDINGYYKFGNPNSGASASKRHDSVTIYFTEEPSDIALEKISKIIANRSRGDNLLGHKISDGFYVSEIGSFKDEQIEELIEQIHFKQSELASVLKTFLLNTHGQPSMSEAQYYVVKDVLSEYGYNLEYNPETGFKL